MAENKIDINYDKIDYALTLLRGAKERLELKDGWKSSLRKYESSGDVYDRVSEIYFSAKEREKNLEMLIENTIKYLENAKETFQKQDKKIATDINKNK